MSSVGQVTSKQVISYFTIFLSVAHTLLSKSVKVVHLNSHPIFFYTWIKALLRYWFLYANAFLPRQNKYKYSSPHAHRHAHTLTYREYSHSSQWAVSPGFSLFVSITEVQSSLIHSQQLTDAVMTIELSIFIHHLRNSRASWRNTHNISNRFSKTVLLELNLTCTGIDDKVSCSFP